MASESVSDIPPPPLGSSLQAIVFRPFKGEVLDAVVTQVNKVST